MAIRTDILTGGQINTVAVKRINEARILQLLYQKCEMTQMELKQELNLSSPTITQAIQNFRRKGLVEDGEELESSGGRKPRKIAFKYSALHSAGVEIRRHHVEVVLIDMKGQVVASETYRLDYENTPAYWTAVNNHIKVLIGTCPQIRTVLGVGIAFPGEVSFNQGMIERATILGLEHVPIYHIKRHFDFDVYIENGASTAGFGVTWRDKAINDAVYIVVTDDGVAGAIILKNHIYRGSGKAGAFGHMTLDPNGKKCFCGARGCWSAYCALSNLSALSGGNLDAFFAGKANGNPQYRAAWSEYLDHFALALTSIMLSLDLDVIIGGKLARYLNDDLPLLRKKIQLHPVLHNEEPRIRLDDIENNTLAVGAALIFVDRFLSGRPEYDMQDDSTAETNEEE